MYFKYKNSFVREKNAGLRKEISQGIAVPMMIGDHDINPGNFIVNQNDECSYSGSSPCNIK